jgi:hypothetical protein
MSRKPGSASTSLETTRVEQKIRKLICKHPDNCHNYLRSGEPITVGASTNNREDVQQIHVRKGLPSAPTTLHAEP